MRQKETFKELLESNKKLVLILMFIVLVLGIGKIFFEKSLHSNKETEELEESEFVKDKAPISRTSGNINMWEMMSIYSEVKDLNPEDTTAIEKVSNKLDKLIKDEN